MTRRRSVPTLALYVVLFLALQFQAIPALAAGPNVGALTAFDVVDSHGIEISRYSLSLEAPGAMDALKTGQVSVVSLLWDSYRWSIGTLAVLLDWTASLAWVPMITSPVSEAGRYLRSSLLAPIGATGFGMTGGLISLFLMIAGLAGGIAIFRGRTGGWMTMIESVAAAVIAVGVLATPVVLFAGDMTRPADPLVQAQRMGVQLSTAAVTGQIPDRPPEPKAEEQISPLKTTYGAILVDSFVRPVHQVINYGASIDAESPECAAVYDRALKEAASVDDLNKVREKLEQSSDCDDKYGQYAKSTNWSQVFAALLFQSTGQLVSVLILTFIVLQWLAVLTLAWSALVLMFQAVLAILPGGAAKAGMLKSLASVVVSLVYVCISTVMLGVVMATVKVLFANPGAELAFRFLGVDLLLIGAIVLLLMNWIWHRKGARTLGQRLASLFSRGRPTETSIGKLINPVAMAREVADSPGGQMAKRGLTLGAQAAAAVATGGTSAVASGGRLLQAGATKAMAMKRAHDQVRHGSSSSNVLTGTVMTADPHEYVAGRVAEARSEAEEHGARPHGPAPHHAAITAGPRVESTVAKPVATDPRTVAERTNDAQTRALRRREAAEPGEGRVLPAVVRVAKPDEPAATMQRHTLAAQVAEAERRRQQAAATARRGEPIPLHAARRRED